LSSSTWLGYNVGVGSCEEETLCALPEAQCLAPPFHPLRLIVRIHLRPYLPAGDLTEPLKAFVRTAREYCGTGATLYHYWRYAEHMAMAGLLPFACEALGEFFVHMHADGFLAVHHSDTFARTYHPAYRVVMRGLLAGIVSSTR
jgi:hypothetical protein